MNSFYMNIKQNTDVNKAKWEAPILKSLDFKNTNGGTTDSWTEDVFNEQGFQEFPS